MYLLCPARLLSTQLNMKKGTKSAVNYSASRIKLIFYDILGISTPGANKTAYSLNVV